MKNTWTIKTSKGKVKFTPLFEFIQEPGKEGKDVECKSIIIGIDEKEYVLNFVNLYQFIYFCANEELRQGLLQRYQRRINKLPYDVTFKLSDDEIKDKMAKRRIELPIDEISMAIARNEAFKLMPRVKQMILNGMKPWELFKGRNK